MIKKSNIYINKNTDFSEVLHFSDGEESIDLTDYSIFGQIRKVYSEKSIADFDFNITDTVAGEVEISLDNEITRNLSPGKYRYDILIQNSTNGEITKKFEGILYINSTITEIN